MALVGKNVVDFLERYLCEELVDIDIPWKLILKNAIANQYFDKLVGSKKLEDFVNWKSYKDHILQYCVCFFPNENATLYADLERYISKETADLYKELASGRKIKTMKRVIRKHFPLCSEIHNYLMCVYYSSEKVKRSKLIEYTNNLMELGNYEYCIKVCEMNTPLKKTTALETVEMLTRMVVKVPPTLTNALSLVKLYEELCSADECIALLENHFIHPKIWTKKTVTNVIVNKIYAEYALLKRNELGLKFLACVYKMCCNLGTAYSYRINVIRKCLLPLFEKKYDKMHDRFPDMFYDVLNVYLVDATDVSFLREKIAPLIQTPEKIQKQLAKFPLVIKLLGDTDPIIQFFNFKLEHLIHIYREKKIYIKGQHRKMDNFMQKKLFFTKNTAPKECTICCETSVLLPTQCYHFFCEDCYFKMLENMKNKCGLCKKEWAFIY